MKTTPKHVVGAAILATAITFGGMKMAGPSVPAPPPPPAPAALEVPTTLKTVAGKQIKIVVTTKAAFVQWLAPEGCDLTPSESGQYAVFSSNTPGKYHVAAWTVGKDGKPTPPAVCEVEVDKPSPAPDPNPKPPLPPGPAPAPNALVAKLQAAYDLDKQPSATRADQKNMLVGIYQALAVKSADKAVPSTTVVMAQMRVAVAGLMKADSLVEVRALVANEAKLQFGDTPAQLTDDLRTKLVTFWNGTADALKQVK